MLRSALASDFVSSALCLETDDVDLQAEDTQAPAVGAVNHYLIRIENDCPGQDESLGEASDGTPRTGVACP